MFQEFSYRGKPSVGQGNLPKLRSTMAGPGTDAFSIPHDDEYQNEYLPDANERLAWSIGFTGSADNAFIFAGRAVLLVDGRYNVQAHSALATARFPIGTTGTHSDTIARLPLWKSGLDFEHGTGHNVGVYLGVHEGPQKNAKGWHCNPLLPGMIVSNDPRYYKVGSYGIRIENHQFVLEASDIECGETPMLGFQILTWLPLSRDLIDLSLLTDEEQDWVNDYHAETLKRLNNRLSKTDATWLGLNVYDSRNLKTLDSVNISQWLISSYLA